MKTISLKRYVVLFIGQFFLGGVNVIEVQELQTLQEPELKQSLQTFDHLILNLPDESQSIAELKSFIISFLKTFSGDLCLPIICGRSNEISTVNDCLFKSENIKVIALSE